MPVGEERLERALEQGVALAQELKRLPKFADWAEARRADESLLTEWQVYRMFEARRGAWSTFQFLVRERLLEAGAEVAPDGRGSRLPDVSKIAYESDRIGNWELSMRRRHPPADRHDEATSASETGRPTRARSSSPAPAAVGATFTWWRRPAGRPRG